MLELYDTPEQARVEWKPFVLSHYPYMLVERLDGKFQWLGLGNYDRTRKELTPKQKQGHIECAHLIADTKRGIEIYDPLFDIKTVKTRTTCR